MLKTLVAAAGGWQPLVLIGLLGALWLLEQILAATNKVRANSITQVVFNALWAWARLRYPLIARLGNVAAPDEKPPTKPGSGGGGAALMLLPLVVLALTGCHGYKAPTYATLATMAGGADVAVQKLPAACEVLEDAAVDAATARAEATEKAGAIHARCESTVTTLQGIGMGLKSVRDAVHDAPDDKPPVGLMPWIQPLMRQYCDAVPLLALFRITLPTLGLC
jgi:hypothetical protein